MEDGCQCATGRLPSGSSSYKSRSERLYRDAVILNRCSRGQSFGIRGVTRYHLVKP
jgi:hypothetical protein